MKKRVVSVPSHGLGDVLYESLALSYLKIIYEETVIFCPKNCIEITQLFNISGIPFYSKLLKNKLKFSITNELNFWRSLKHYRGYDYFSTFNDLIDKLICRKGGFNMVSGAIGNYFRVFPYGWRSVLNKTLTFFGKQKGSNPRHFFLRIHNVVSSVCPVSKEDLLTHFRKDFLTVTAPSVSSSNSLFIFPDSSNKKKELTAAQVEYIIRSYGSFPEIIIYSDRHFSTAGTNVTVVKFNSVKETFTDTRRASLVFAADSFPAHFSGLSGIKTIVIYQQAKIKKYCEYWGAPYNNVFHVEEGAAYLLDDDFSAVGINDEKDADLNIARKVSVIV